MSLPWKPGSFMSGLESTGNMTDGPSHIPIASFCLTELKFRVGTCALPQGRGLQGRLPQPRACSGVCSDWSKLNLLTILAYSWDCDSILDKMLWWKISQGISLSKDTLSMVPFPASRCYYLRIWHLKLLQPVCDWGDQAWRHSHHAEDGRTEE
jgi:hypothetical protein